MKTTTWSRIASVRTSGVRSVQAGSISSTVVALQLRYADRAEVLERRVIVFGEARAIGGVAGRHEDHHALARSRQEHAVRVQQRRSVGDGMPSILAVFRTGGVCCPLPKIEENWLL